MSALDALTGEWEFEIEHEDFGRVGGRQSCEPLYGGPLLEIRSTVDKADFPDSLSVICPADDDGGFAMHYFDSRGVRRVYEMSLEDRVWRLFRESRDPFPQRFIGTISDDGRTIAGAWERQDDGAWVVDFEMTYRRAG
jgi:hypothetical protein